MSPEPFLSAVQLTIFPLFNSLLYFTIFLQICLYEFLTGFPPYCDETVEKIFENILSNNMEWPEGEEELSAQAVDCIQSLLCRDPELRANQQSLKQHQLFQV